MGSDKKGLNRSISDQPSSGSDGSVQEKHDFEASKMEAFSQEKANSRIDFTGFLRDLGLVGLEALEVPLLSSMVTGDPILLIGSHGTAKTTLVRTVAEAVDLEFQSYDASKALFEDIIGFPDPNSLSDGNLKYVPTVISLWDKECILVDEISRAAPRTQSKWLEVIRSRSLMGESLSSLKYIFAAMNPPGSYPGAQPLDPALAGRFSYFLRMPDAREMNRSDREALINTVSGDDAPLTQNVLTNSIGSKGRQDLTKMVREVRHRLKDVHDNYNKLVVDYLSRLCEQLKSEQMGEEGNRLDGRRLGMMRRNLLAEIAICDPDRDDLFNRFLRCLKNSLPHSALGEERPDHIYKMAHRRAFREVSGGTQSGHSTSLSLNTLIRRALDKGSPEEAVPDLARLGGQILDVSFQDESISADALGRLFASNGKLTERNNRVRWMNREEYQRSFALFWTADSGIESMAVWLLVWWLEEKNDQQSGRNRTYSYEDLKPVIQQLSTLITTKANKRRDS